MATGGLYGQSTAGIISPQSGSESVGLYGNNTVFGGTYFEWLIFQESATQPATPTGGSWSFSTNTGTPPSGWTLQPPVAPVNQVWVSIALVNSKTTATLVWSTPGLFGVVPNFSFPTPVTGPAGSSAAVVNLGTATNPSLQFTIPRGDTGATGAAATIAVGTTTTTNPGTSATVTNSGTSGAAVFNFGIPRGAGVNSGGSAGQVLTKASSTDYDTTWTTITGTLNYRGTWNASTNTPALTSSVGTNGYYYVVNVAGSTNLNGITDWQVGDWAIFNGSTWQKIDQTNTVTSVNGQTGTVVLTAADVAALSGITSADGSITVSQVGTVVDLAVSAASPASTLLLQVRNNSGATMTKGTVVYINSAVGQLPTIAKALATSDATSAQTQGLVTADIANNANGYVTIVGLVTNLDTSAYTDGAQLYLSGVTAGAMTATKQYAPIHLVYVGIVVHAHPTQGKIQVKVQNGYELDELHNVSAQSPTNGQTIVYNSATSLWEKSTVSLTAGVNGTLPIANGGTGQTTQAAALTALAGTQVSGRYLRSDGTNTSLSAIQAADVPTLNQNTTGSASGGASGPIAATTLTASSDPSFTSTGAVQLPSGTTAQQPTGVAGKLRFNTTTSQFEGYNGSTWASVGGAAITNDTSTATAVYPLFASATSGTALTVYTSNSNYLYTPSTGELKAKAHVSTNGITVNSDSVSSNMTIASGTNGFSIGPLTINSGVVLTIASGQRHVVI